MAQKGISPSHRENLMEGATSTLPGGGMVGKIIFVVLSLVALYYLYQFLFGPTGLEGKTVLNSVKDASPDKPYVTFADGLPALYEGGEYSVNAWIYINDYSVNRGLNKPIFTLGGTSFLTLAVYLGPYKNTLQVRVHTKQATPGTTGLASQNPSPKDSEVTDDLSSTVVKMMFGNLQQENSILYTPRACDITSVDLQKWVQISVCLNNKTCDVYMDGKLARSCVLPGFYKVDKSNLALAVCDYKGFGGYVSNVSAYNYALNPEQVWRLYMSGPGPQYGFVDYIKSMFDPKAVSALDYPKQNIVPGSA
jgi:hypothetical protein